MEQVEYIVLKFASLNLLSFEEESVTVHDLLLDVCMYEARNRNMTRRYHEHLLRGYYCDRDGEHGCSEPILFYSRVGTGSVHGIKRVRRPAGIEAVRPWWNEDLHCDGYLGGNVARHLVASGNVEELRKLLCDARWTAYRVESGNLLSWKGDFAELDRGGLTGNEDVMGRVPEEVDSRVKVIRDAVTLAWSFLMLNPKELGFQMFGRLRGLETEYACVGEYLESVGRTWKKPWLMPMRRCLPSPKGPLQLQMNFEESVHAVVLAPVKPQAFLAVGTNIVVVDMEQQKITMEMKGQTDNVKCLAFSTDGQLIVSGSMDKTLRVWDVKTGIQVGEAEGHTDGVICVAIKPDGKRIASGSYDKTLRVWDVDTGRQVGEVFEGHTDSVTCVAITPDGKQIVSGSYDGTLRVWDVDMGSQVGEALEGHTNWLKCVAITSDGKQIVSGSYDGTLRVWDVKTGIQVGEALEGHTDGVICVAITPDGKQIVSGSYDGTLRVWDVDTGRQVGEVFEGHTDGVTCVAITPNGKQIVSGSYDGTLRVWDVDMGSQVGEALEGHTDGVICVAITPDGKRIVSGSWDKTLRMWDVDTGRQVGEVFEGHTDSVTCVAITSDGKRIVSGSYDETLRLWDVDTGSEVGQERRVHERDSYHVQISKSGVVTSYSGDQVVRLRIDERLGLVVMSQLEAGEEDATQHEIETDTEIYAVTCTGEKVLMEFPEKQLLGTLAVRGVLMKFNKK